MSRTQRYGLPRKPKDTTKGLLETNKDGLAWFGQTGNHIERGLTVDPIIGNLDNRTLPRFKDVDMVQRYKDKEKAKQERLKATQKRLREEKKRKRQEVEAQREIDAKRRTKKAKLLKIEAKKDEPKYYKTKKNRANKPKYDKRTGKWQVCINYLGTNMYFGQHNTESKAQKHLDELNSKKFDLFEKLNMTRLEARTDKTKQFIKQYLKNDCLISYKTLLALYGKDDQVF